MEVSSENEFILDDAEMTSNAPVRLTASAHSLARFWWGYIVRSGACIPWVDYVDVRSKKRRMDSQQWSFEHLIRTCVRFMWAGRTFTSSGINSLSLTDCRVTDITNEARQNAYRRRIGCPFLPLICLRKRIVFGRVSSFAHLSFCKNKCTLIWAWGIGGIILTGEYLSR